MRVVSINITIKIKNMPGRVILGQNSMSVRYNCAIKRQEFFSNYARPAVVVHNNVLTMVAFAFKGAVTCEIVSKV